MKKIDKPVKKILIVQTAFIGDVVLTLPLVQTAKAFFNGAIIDFLTIPTSRDIVATHPDINHIWLYDKRGSDRGIKNYLSLAGKLRKTKYDLVLVPHRSIRSAGLAWLSRSPRRVGFHRSAGRMLFTDVVPYPYGIHESVRNLHLLKPFGFQPEKAPLPALGLTDEDRLIVDEFLGDANNRDELIALAPGSVWATKRWLPEYFAQLSDELHRLGYHTVLIGGPGDREIGETVCHLATNKPLNAVGRLPLRASAELIRRSKMLISNDSAPMHLAVAVRTPVVAIFGPTVREFGFYPIGEYDAVAEIEGLSCRPCGRHGHQRCPIGTFDCMIKLTPDRVLNLANQILEKVQQTEQ